MPNLTPEQILSAAGDTEDIPVPEWLPAGTELDPDDPPTVLVRGLDTAYIQELMKKGLLDDEGIPVGELDFAEIAARSMIHAGGKRMFTNRKQVDKIAEKTFGPVVRIAMAAMTLAGLGKKDADDVGESDEETADPKADEAT